MYGFTELFKTAREGSKIVIRNILAGYDIKNEEEKEDVEGDEEGGEDVEEDRHDPTADQTDYTRHHEDVYPSSWTWYNYGKKQCGRGFSLPLIIIVCELDYETGYGRPCTRGGQRSEGFDRRSGAFAFWNTFDNEQKGQVSRFVSSWLS